MQVLSYGAGVQSKTLLYMACKGEITPKPDLVVFSDPGWETDGTYDDLKRTMFDVRKYGIEVTVTQIGNIRDDLLDAAHNGNRVASLPFFTKAADGTQGMIMRQCTTEYKIQGVRKAILRHLGASTARQVKEPVTMWMGISTDEIERVTTSRERWIINRYPLIEKMMNRLDCMNWLERNGLEVPPKSSCIGCPFHDDRTWLEMKRNDPKSWNDAVMVDREIRKLPKIRGEVYLHRSCKPLDEVELFEDQLEMNLFGNECTGYCGV